MKFQSLSLENRFLIDCLRAGLDKDSRHIDQASFSELNWETILEKATIHYIGSFLFYTIQKTCHNLAIPNSFKDTLNSIYQVTLKRNLFIYHIVDKIMKSFQNKGVPFLFIRGPLLGENLYSNIGLRPMGDLDILLKEEDLQKASETFHQLGYQASIPFHAYQMIYINKDSKMSLDIDLHWALEPKLEKDAEKIWENTCTSRINNTEVLMLRPELLLGHLLTHLDKHIRIGEAKLIWFCDAYLLIKYYGRTMDWGYFLNKIEKDKLQKPVYEILTILKDWFKATLPSYVADRLKVTKYSYSEKDIFDPDPTRKQITYISSIPKIQGIFNKIYYILKVIFPNKRLMTKFYSKDQKSFSYFFYLYRLYKMFVVISNTILRKLKCSIRY